MKLSLSCLRLLAITALGSFTLSVSAIAQNSFGDDTSRTMPPPPSQSPPPNPPPPSPDRQMPGPQVQPPVQPVPSPGASTHTDGRFAQVEKVESEDFGIPPTDQLHVDPMHAPTPTRIPGGLVITTEALNGLYEKNAGQFIVFDVLGGQKGLPGAQKARPAGNAGSFTDQNQRDFGTYLQSVTQGNKQMPLVFYCQSNHCWLSYNAALRAIKLGYTQVLWYRGGIEAWEQAGLPTYGPGAQ